jgi:uncharacterized membrane protein YkoI
VFSVRFKGGEKSRMKKSIYIALILMQILCFGFPLARAEHRPPAISATEAKRMAEDRFGGKALSAKFEDGGGAGSVYRVKLIKAGRVKTVTIQATP